MAKQLTPFPASPDIVDNLQSKHGIVWEEIEEVFGGRPRLFRIMGADQYGEPRYSAWGRTLAGRYLIVVCVPVKSGRAKVITARDMHRSERRRFSRK